MTDFSSLTEEQLNQMDKHVLITIIKGLQLQLNSISSQLEFLTEQIALMNQRSFGRKTEKANGLRVYEYLEYVLTELAAHQDDTSRDFLADLLPWSNAAQKKCSSLKKGSKKI